jgi:hypothetical protein
VRADRHGSKVRRFGPLLPSRSLRIELDFPLIRALADQPEGDASGERS